MIDGILERLIAEIGGAEIGGTAQTVATGGQARLITSGSRYLTNADEDLTLEGLRLIWERTR